MKIGTLRGFAAACLATTAVVGVVAPAFAQIEEIIVTTRKRAENLQEIPIVVTAFTAENIERKGIAGLNDVLKYTAGVQILEGFAPQDQRIVIRGLSPTRGRPNVAVLQDDIDISSESINTAGGSLLINTRLFDVERIEIVKGPHSALYGRSAFAGAINYISKKPGDEFEGSVSTDLATYGKYEGKVGVSGPMIPDVLNVGVNAAYWNFDGFYKNSLTGKKLGGTEGKGVAATAIWKGSDILKATFRGEYTNDESDQSARAVYRANVRATVPASARTDVPTAAGGTVGRGLVISPALTTFPIVSGAIPDGKDLTIAIAPDPRTGRDYEGVTREIARFTLRLDAEFSAVNVSTMSHYGDADVTQWVDGQNSGVDLFRSPSSAENHFETKTKLHTEELRLQSNDDESALKWTVGGLYWNEEANQLSLSVSCFTSLPLDGAPPFFGPALGSLTDNCGRYVQAYGTTVPFSGDLWGRNTFHSSVYALVDFDVTDQFSVTSEIRRTWEREHTKGPSGGTYAIDPYGIVNQGSNNAALLLRDAAGNPVALGTATTAPIIYKGLPVTAVVPGVSPVVNGVAQPIAVQVVRSNSGVIIPAGCAPAAFPPGQRSDCIGQQSGATIGEFFKSSFWTPRVGLNFKVNEDLLTYASLSRGYKPGGVSTVSGGGAPLVRSNLQYDPEKMWVYEAGFKSTFADGKALFNAAAYYQDYSDKQASTQVLNPNGTLSTRIVNAASARTYGVDIEAAFSPTQEWNFSAGYTWLDAKYGDYTVRTGGATPIVRSQSCTPVVTYRLADGSTSVVVNPTTAPAGATIVTRTCDVDKSGHKLEFAPTHSLQLNALYKQDLGGDMRWVTEVSLQAESKRWTDDDEASYLHGFVTADLRTGLETDTWSVTAYVNNITNDDTVKAGIANTDFSPARFQFSPAPATFVLPNQYIPILPDKRQFGVRANYKF
jgi:outer membrane receptor protein involved in Fe transport